MKKILFTLFIVGCLVFSANAQLNIGIKGGAIFTNPSFDFSGSASTLYNGMKMDGKTSYEFGAFVAIGNKFYVQPEVVFRGQGGVTEWNEVEQTGVTLHSLDTKLTTLDVPILVGYKIINAKAFNVRILAGPVASFKLSQKDVYSVNDIKQSIDRELEDNFDIKTANWSIQAGAGVDVLMFRLDLKYEWGLTNLASGDDFDIKSNLFSVSLGWKIL